MSVLLLSKPIRETLNRKRQPLERAFHLLERFGGELASLPIREKVLLAFKFNDGSKQHMLGVNTVLLGEALPNLRLL